MTKYFSMNGYVCGEVEQRTTQSGKTVTQFSINSPSRREVDGEWKTVPHFFRCQYWHRGERDFRADWIQDKAHLQISGEPRYEEWERDGKKRSTVRFNVSDILLIARKDDAPPKREAQDDVYDDDIPF